MQKVLIQDQEETPVILGLCQKGHPASTYLMWMLDVALPALATQ